MVVEIKPLISLNGSGLSTTTASSDAPQPSTTSTHPREYGPTTLTLTLLLDLLPIPSLEEIAFASPSKTEDLVGPLSLLPIAASRAGRELPPPGSKYHLLAFFKDLTSLSTCPH